MKILLIIPTYNEAQEIERTVETVLEFFRKQQGIAFTLVISDSSDKDNTEQIARALAEKNPEVEVDRYPDGTGKGEKIRRTTTTHVPYDAYAFIDADLPITMEEFSAIVRGVTEGKASISIASKYVKHGGSNRTLYRTVVSRAGNYFFNFFLRLPVHDFLAGSKAWDHQVVEQIWPHVENNTYFFDVELMYLANKRGFSIHEVPVTYVDARVGASKVNVPKLGWEFCKNTASLLRRRA